MISIPPVPLQFPMTNAYAALAAQGAFGLPHQMGGGHMHSGRRDVSIMRICRKNHEQLIYSPAY